MTDSVFRVLTRDGHLFEVWEDGRIEGFGDNVAAIYNAIPLIELRVRAEHRANEGPK